MSPTLELLCTPVGYFFPKLRLPGTVTVRRHRFRLAQQMPYAERLPSPAPLSLTSDWWQG
jgi:hypothetical protein